MKVRELASLLAEVGDPDAEVVISTSNRTYDVAWVTPAKDANGVNGVYIEADDEPDT